MKRIQLLDLFSGIGGFRQAASIAAKDARVPFQCIAQSDNDRYANLCYEIFYEMKNELKVGDIVEFTKDLNKVKNLSNFNLLTGGFPCQPFSMMGAKRGFEDDRGTLFYNILNIIDTKKPKVILLENVKNINTHDDGKTIKKIYKLLTEKGYKYINHDIFNTANFGLPQTRNRVYIVALRDKPKDFVFSFKSVKTYYDKLKSKSVSEYKDVLDILGSKVDKKYYLSEKIKPTILAHGGGNFISKSEINQIIARPLVATMGKMHRACQDNYYSDTFIKTKGKRNDAGEPINSLIRKRIRKLTPHEAFLLQGFPIEFVEAAYKNGISNAQLYKQAGNAVSVNVAYAIIRYLIKFYKM